jgi:hypothetical protein
MNDLKYVYTNADGTVAVIHAAPKTSIEEMLGPLTDEEYEAHVLEKSVPAGAISVRRITEDDIPGDRKYRDCWCDVTPHSAIDIHLGKVQEQLLNELRAERKDYFQELDYQYMRAVEQGTDTAEIIAAKQELRDITEPLKAIKLLEDEVNDPTKLAALEAAAVISPTPIDAEAASAEDSLITKE